MTEKGLLDVLAQLYWSALLPGKGAKQGQHDTREDGHGADPEGEGPL
jgi:hypothetical protein